MVISIKIELSSKHSFQIMKIVRITILLANLFL